MHAQHFVDNQTIHRRHRSSPFVFRSQVVYRHTDSDSPCEHTPAFSFGRVPVWGLQRKARSTERLQAEKRARRFTPAYIKDRSRAARSLAIPPAAAVLADSFARISQRSWSRSDPWPRTQCHFVSCWPATDANSSHKSRFAMASPRLLHQPQLRQRTRDTVIPCSKYWESVVTVTLHASVRALRPLMAATSSIRLFVVCGSTPRRMRSCFPYRRMHAHPPGPGLPKHDPSVKSVTSFNSLTSCLPGSRDRRRHAGVAILSSSVSAVCTLPMSAAPRVLKLANVNVPFAAWLITTASGRPVAPETRFASRSSRPRNSLKPAVSPCDPCPAVPLLVPFGGCGEPLSPSSVSTSRRSTVRSGTSSMDSLARFNSRHNAEYRWFPAFATAARNRSTPRAMSCNFSNAAVSLAISDRKSTRLNS